jgi:hypothetical protein
MNIPEILLNPQFLLEQGKGLYLIFLLSIPLSLFFYILYSRYRHWILVDLGEHKWLVK